MEEIKDLGGLVNKDLAFSKLPQGAVFDSQNFRITTDDGNTTAARETIKGTVLTNNIPLGTCIYSIVLDQGFLQTALILNETYEILFSIGGVSLATPFVVQYVNFNTLVQDITDYINSTAAFQVADITASFNSNSITVISNSCNSIGIVSFVTTTPVLNTEVPYELWDKEFAVSNDGTQDYNTLNGVTGPKLWGLYGQSVVPSNSSMTTGNITSYANVLLDNFSTNLRLDITYNNLLLPSNYYEVIKGFHKYDFFGSPIRGQIFEAFPTGIYEYIYSFYVKKDAPVTGNVKLYAQLGSNIDSAIDPTITVDTIDGVDYVLIDTVPLLAGVTDVDYLDTLGGSKVVNFNYSKPLFGQPGVAISNGGASSYRFDHAIVIETTGAGLYSDPSGNFTNNSTWVDMTIGPAAAYYSYPGGNVPVQINFTINYYVDPALNQGTPYIIFDSDVLSSVSIDHVTYCFTNGLPYTGNFSISGSYIFQDPSSWDLFPRVEVDSGMTPPTITNVEILSGNYTITDVNTGALLSNVGFSPSGNLNVAFGSVEAWQFGSTLVGVAPYNATLYADFISIKAPALNLLLGVTVNNLASGLNNNYIIGWVSLRDDLYIFTTDGVFDPDDPTTWGGATPPSTTGQIWKFSYNKAGNYANASNYNLSLVYSNPNTQFTVYRPIANPGMIEARYENEFIQKIYWTDNYNPPRQINVADPNVLTLPVSSLALLPALSMDVVELLQVLDNGALKAGVYRVAYRLKNASGSESRFSRLSRAIPLIGGQGATEDPLDAANYYSVRTYYPKTAVGNSVNKSIKVRINNIDTNYDAIELVTLYYKDDTTPPEIYLVKEELITASTMDFLITGNEADPIEITTEELTAFTSTIRRVKTIAAKKQTLFLGNVTVTSPEVTFDARAYRFPINSLTTNIQTEATGSTDTVTYDPVNNTYTYNNTLNPIPETHDCLQSYASQAPTSDQNNLYQPNSTVFGGAGPNIKYEFFTDYIQLDAEAIGANGPSGARAASVVHPSLPVINFNALNGTSFTSPVPTFGSNASPYIYDVYAGYRRDEMYRFGIVFFDELDNPTYVNWIADIRMPHIFMPNTGQSNAVDNTAGKRSRIGYSLNSSFSSDHTYYDASNGYTNLYGRPLGVKFTIDFSGLPYYYKKAMIVRTEVKPEYKHILGQGLFVQTYKSSGTTEDYKHVFLSNPYKGTFFYNGYNDIWYDCWTYRSPDFLIDKNPSFNSGDKMDVLGVLQMNWWSTYQVLRGSSYFAAENIQWVTSGSAAFEHLFVNAYHAKNYKFNETSSNVPNTIKNSGSSNPYPIIFTRPIALRESDGATLNNAQRWRLGASTITTGGGFSTARTIFNCSPKSYVDSPQEYPATSGIGVGQWFNGSTNNVNSNPNKNLFIQLQSNPAENFNVYGGTPNYGNLDGLEGGSNNYPFYLANYTRNVSIPFGGQSYISRSVNEYIACNNLIDISNKTVPIQTKVYGGDTVVSLVDHVMHFWDFNVGFWFKDRRSSSVVTPGQPYRNSMGLGHLSVYFPAENYVNIELRQTDNTPIRANPGYVEILGTDPDDPGYANKLENEEQFIEDKVYFHSTITTPVRYYPEPALVKTSGVFDCRIWKSEPKEEGELLDSWSVFKPGAHIHVESAYGPINNLIIFQDKLYYFQDRGFGIAQVAAQQVLANPDPSLGEFVLGSSGILERYDYVSTKTGTKHQFSMSVSDYSMIWFDTLARKMYRYKPGALEPVSDMKGYSAYVYARTGGNFQTFDNPYIGRGIHSTYDYRHGEFYMTFLDDEFQDTLVYTDFFDGFVGSYTHYPKVYINDKVNIFGVITPPSTSFDSIYIHNYGPYGKFYDNLSYDDAKVSFVVNSNPTIEKVFTNLEIVAESYKANLTGNQNYDSLSAIDYTDFFDTFRVYDNYQNTDYISTSLLSRRHKTIWNMKVPSDRVLDVTQNIFDPVNLSGTRPAITRRMKDKWFVVDLTYQNQLTQGQNRFVAHSAKALYSINSR